MSAPRVVIVGAGPAGVAAAEVLLAHGVQVTLVDEAPRPGGQVYRSPPEGLALDMDALLGAESRKYRRFHARFQVLSARLDYRPETLVWHIEPGTVHLAANAGLDELAYDALILATGATDRIMPVRGWTLPGVFTLGGAQVLLKDQGCLIGRRVVFAGSSPLLYVAALQYAGLGARVEAVLDTTPFPRKIAALGRLVAVPGLLRRGLRDLAVLRRRGIPVWHGVRIDAFAGEDGVAAVIWRTAHGERREAACDAVAYGHGLRPETQLAELAGCELRYDRTFRHYFPVQDSDGRCGNQVYVAGDGGSIGGSDAAACSGALAGRAVLADFGRVTPFPGAATLRRRLRRLRRFQRGLAQAFAWPHAWAGTLPDEVPVCRCENISAGELRRAFRNETEVNRIKAATRCGMGRCQGRFCGPAAAELAAAVLGRQDRPLDRLRAQAPIKPLSIAAACTVP